MQGIIKSKKKKIWNYLCYRPPYLFFKRLPLITFSTRKANIQFIVMTTATQNVTRQNGCTKMTSSRTSQEAF